MKYDFFFDPIFLLTVNSFLFFIIILLIHYISAFQVTRITMIFFGVLLITLAGFAYSRAIDLANFSEKLLKAGELSQEAHTTFINIKDIFIYIFPFVSAALGTNIISDALTKNQKYEKTFSVLELMKDATYMITALFGVIFVIIAAPFIILAAIITPSKKTRARCISAIKAFYEHTANKLSKLKRLIQNQTKKANRMG